MGWSQNLHYKLGVKLLLLQASFRDYPFPYILVDQSFTAAQCAKLEGVFSQTGDWQHRDGSFYQCSILDVTRSIPLALQHNVLSRMRELTGLTLSEDMLITAQCMQPGQVIGIHSDRPLLGYELLRLVVQFNSSWSPEDGGLLELFSSADGGAVASIEPLYNKGFIFELHNDSYHAVTKVTQPRNSLVFNFWHVANTPQLKEYIKGLFVNLHFSELPDALEPVASALTIDLPEDITFVAETAAVALKRWGFDDAAVIAGYQFSVGQMNVVESNSENFSAVRIANWVATLFRRSFNLVRWQTLSDELVGVKIPKRLEKIWPLCFPNHV